MDDIRQYGLREPVVLDQRGRILDGRNRARACSALGIEPAVQHFSGTDEAALAYVVSLNVKRRHLDTSQRAMVAAKLATMRQGARTDLAQVCAKSQAEAAKLLNVGERSVEHASRVQKSGAPSLQQAVERGDIAVSAAAELARVPVERQGDILRKVISHALAEDSAPTKADIQRAINGNYTLQVMLSSESTEWYTPAHIRELALEALGAIDLDPCWHREAPIKASTTYTMAQDGLAHPWSGRVWLNPPYGRAIGLWIDKLVDEHAAGRVTEALALIPARVDTDWFRALDPFPRCFPHGRLVFANAENSAPFPVAIPYLGPNVERFAAVFGALGRIWALWRPDAAAGITPA